MIDFTSALYLGLTHPAWSLRPWAQLTTGRPAVPGAPTAAATVADAVAALTGCEAASLRSSTLHVFWDLFGMLGPGHRIFMDAGAYPIAHWGALRAEARGTGITVFDHYDAVALRAALQRVAPRLRPVVVADGFCPSCGRAAPVEQYLSATADRGGYVVLDDTQGLGVLGTAPSARAPYGHGGGGTLRYRNVSSPRVVLVSSLAKAFGVPVAVLAGSAGLVARFDGQSDTRVHTSPPSTVVIHAAQRAIEVNTAIGDGLRGRLRRAVARFQSRALRAGLTLAGGAFPAQTLVPVAHVDGRRLHARLATQGVLTVLQGNRRASATITLLITARHTTREVELAADALASAVDEEAGADERGGYEHTDYV